METSGGAFGAAACAGLAEGRRTGATGRFATLDGLGAARGVGAADRFGAAARFGTARRFRAAARTRGIGRRGAIAGFDVLGAGAVRDFAVLRLDDLRLGDLRFSDLRFCDLRFGDLRRDAVATTFAPAAAFPEAADFRVRSPRADLAALAFFFACLAAFLLAFASFRACLSALLAARRRRFAASARAAAWLASDWSRRAAAAWLARDEGDLEVATSYSLK